MESFYAGRTGANACAARGSFENYGRGERIRTSGLYVPNVALYQAKLHPECLAARVVKVDLTNGSQLADRSRRSLYRPICKPAPVDQVHIDDVRSQKFGV